MEGFSGVIQPAVERQLLDKRNVLELWLVQNLEPYVEVCVRN